MNPWRQVNAATVNNKIDGFRKNAKNGEIPKPELLIYNIWNKPKAVFLFAL